MFYVIKETERGWTVCALSGCHSNDVLWIEYVQRKRSIDTADFALWLAIGNHGEGDDNE